jgi:hypothetical protein
MLYIISKVYSVAFNNVILTIIGFILYNPFSFRSHTTHFPKAHGTRVENTGLEQIHKIMGV